ncbi:MAG: GGDEF domain-containing protein [Alphaproteobacteria bacterium]|nr:GGDEF domain-containing protein [Alphaproteobacteria bacterium]
MTKPTNNTLVLPDEGAVNCLKTILDTSLFPAAITDAEFKKILYINSKAQKLLTLDEGDEFSILADEQDRNDIIEQTNKDGNSLDLQIPVSTLECADMWINVHAAKLDMQGTPCIYACFENLTELRRLEEKLRQLNRTDKLTGTINHSHFLEIGEKEISRCKRHGNPMSVLVLDIDNFTTINAKQGHEVGDEVIKATANKIQDALRSSDVVSRMGFEEFAIILTETTGEYAKLTSERICKTLSKLPIPYENEKRKQKNLKFTVSIGVTELIPEDNGIETALSRAYMALQKAKREGKNQAQVM